MHPRLAELADDLARHRAALLAAVASVPADQLERRASAEGWSVAEVVDHLQLVETGTARLLAKRIARAKEAGVGAETRIDSVRDQMDRYAIVDSPRKIVAPEMVRPRGGVSAREALDGLQRSREALLAALGEGTGLDLTQVTAIHALFGELDVYGWVVWLGQHEGRHARQVQAIRDDLARAGLPSA